MKTRLQHFETNDSFLLKKWANDIYHSSNFIHSNSKTAEQARREVAESHATFIDTLKVGNVVHICNGSDKTVTIGKVESIDIHTVKIENNDKQFELSEVHTIDF